MNHIILEGFAGAGKNPIAKKISKEMGLNVIVINKKISERMKMKTSDIMEKYGDIYYHAAENFELSKLMRLRKRHIIVVGSGLPEHPANAKLLRELGRVYYLKKSPKGIAEAVKASDPKYEDIDINTMTAKYAQSMKEKEVFYIDCADVIIDVDKETSAGITSIILNDVVKFDSMPAEAPAEEPKKKSRKKKDAE